MVNNPLLNNSDSEFDPDLEVSRPAYSTLKPSGSLLKLGLMSLSAIAVTGLAAALYFYAYQRGLEDGQKSNPPVIAADPGPSRLTPKEAGVDTIPPADLEIYDIAQGNAPDSNNGAPESLLRKQDGIAETPSAASNKISETPQTKVVAPEPVAKAPVVEPAKPTETASKPSAPAKIVDAKPNAPRYMVQVAATRSRALARSTFGDMQKKYSELLNGRDPLILRIDLGSKGIFYRVNIGGFSSRDDANTFCASLKKAGQDCLVKNEPN